VPTARSGFGRAASFAVPVVVLVALLLLENFAITKYFPRLERLPADVSRAYLQREVGRIAASAPQTIFLGDSVVWGYRVSAGETAVSILASRGCACRNLALRAGSPPNDYAIVQLLLAAGARPKTVVLEVDQQSFNPFDDDYARLLPGISLLASPLFSTADRRLLLPPVNGQGIMRRLDYALSSMWLLYAMRADIRGTYFPGPEEVPVTHPTADKYLGTYNLTPLNEQNVGIHFLTETVDRLRGAGIPVVAFMTPTNHELLHDYIDSDAYRANASFVKKLLENRGARVIDLDAAFPSRLFFDNAHLRPAGHQLLAEKLASVLSATQESFHRIRTARPSSVPQQPLSPSRSPTSSRKSRSY
jgi:hypothetical protein